MDAERSSTASRQTRSRSAPGQEEACTQAAEKQLCQRLVEGCKAIEHSRGGGSLELALTRGLNMNDCFLNVRREESQHPGESSHFLSGTLKQHGACGTSRGVATRRKVREKPFTVMLRQKKDRDG
jgi:hypothetical protein